MSDFTDTIAGPGHPMNTAMMVMADSAVKATVLTTNQHPVSAIWALIKSLACMLQNIDEDAAKMLIEGLSKEPGMTLDQMEEHAQIDIETLKRLVSRYERMTAGGQA
tara:strand:+ start:46087 stop:46407 length:321 start_codon:yes stop_codon:yes gene_type:complete